MTKRRVKNIQKSIPASSMMNNINSNGDTSQEDEQQMAAIRAIRDLETNRLLTSLRLLRSYFNNEQSETPVMKYFEENLSNLSIVGNEDQFQVQWKSSDFMKCADGSNLHASLLHQLHYGSSAFSNLKGFSFSSKVTNRNGRSSDDFQFQQHVMDMPASGSQIIGYQDGGLQTPGATSHGLSVGVTPKTLRRPKKGEMLVSAHGSPLGVYKEDSMEAINESEEGSAGYA